MSASITPGQLRHLVQWQQRSTSRDTLGQEIQTWTTAGTLFAAIEPTLGGRPQIAGEAQASASTLTVSVRWRSPGPTARDRLVYGTRVLEIDSVTDVDEQHFWLQLGCTEGLSQG